MVAAVLPFLPPAVEWEPTVGDPTVIDWIITCAYFIAAGFCLRAGWREMQAVRLLPARRRAWAPFFWFLLFAILWLLGINKQLDFQTLLIQVGREMSEQQGWFESRRAVQKQFLIALACGSVVVLGLIAFWLRRAWKRYLLPLAGLAVLAGYVMVRASLFSHQSILRSEVDAHQTRDAVMELGGNLLICVGAWRAIGSANAAARSAPPPGKAKYQSFERVVRIR